MYFPEDGETLKGVSPQLIKLPPTDPVPDWAKMTRKQYLNTPFKMDKQTWTAVKVGTGKFVNKYLCTCEGKRKTTQEEYKDVGKVMKILLKDIFPFSKLFG